MPPLASSFPEIGRNWTETSTSSNFRSSKIATAQGCVSAVWASTWRPPDARRTHRPAKNFHFACSCPKSSFMVSASGDVMVSRGASGAAAIAAALMAKRDRTASVIFMEPPSFRRVSVQGRGHDFPVVAADEGDLRDWMTTVQARHRAHRAVPWIAVYRFRRGGPERALGAGHGGPLVLSGREICAVGESLDPGDHSRAEIDDDFGEAVASGGVGLERVDGQLEDAILELVLGRDRDPLGRAQDESAFEREP